MKVQVKGTPNVEAIRKVAEEIAREIYQRKREELYENNKQNGAAKAI